MKKLLQRGGYALAVLVTLFGAGLAAVLAQDASQPGNGFRISPVRSEFTINKGKSEALVINLENPSDSPTIAKPIVNDFIASEDESGEPRLILDESAPSPKNSFKSLVSGLASVPLGSREKKDIIVPISVPEAANAGGYYGAVRFEPQVAGSSNEQTNVGLTASVGTIVLIRVPGDLTERLDLVQISAATKAGEGKDPYRARNFFTSGNVAVMTRLKNTGDIHVKPFGKVKIKNTFGKVIHEYEFNDVDPKANILPDSTRKFGDDLPNKKWFGRYTIEANLGYSQGSGDLITAKATFWYIPTLALWGILIGLLLIVGAVYWYIRRHKARKQHKHDVNKIKS